MNLGLVLTALRLLASPVSVQVMISDVNDETNGKVVKYEIITRDDAKDR